MKFKLHKITQAFVGLLIALSSFTASSDPLEKEIYSGLSNQERAVIEAKRKAILFHMATEEALQDLRDKLQEDEKNKQYERELEDIAPLSNEEILLLKKSMLSAKKIENSPINGGPSMNIETIDYDINSATPIKIRVAEGYNSSLVFFDQTGQPWPIEADDTANNIFQAGVISSFKNTLRIQIKEEFTHSNTLLYLAQLPIPLVISLVGDNEVIDSRVSVRIPRSGPNAVVEPMVQTGLENNDPRLLTILGGHDEQIANAKVYKLNNVEGEAIYTNNELYIRSDHLLISPPWRGSSTSITGKRVYRIPPTRHLIFSVDGELVNATVSGRENINIKYESSIFK